MTGLDPEAPAPTRHRSPHDAVLDVIFWPLYRPFRGTALEGVLLYAATLLFELALAASARWLLAYGAVEIFALLVDPGLVGAVLPLAFALIVFPFSLLALLLPDEGASWARRIGARSLGEEELHLLEGAISSLWRFDPILALPSRFYVLDTPVLGAAAHGRSVLLTRGMLDSEALAAAVAHELGHVHSLDSRLVGALQWLVLWREPATRGSRLARLALAPLGLAAGGIGRRLLGVPWRSYWVEREFAADAYAGALGQAVPLAIFLMEGEAAMGAGEHRLLSAVFNHPPTPARIERLLPWFELEPPR